MYISDGNNNNWLTEFEILPKTIDSIKIHLLDQPQILLVWAISVVIVHVCGMERSID